MAISTHTAQTALSVSSTELSLINGNSSIATNTTAGVYQLFIDTANMAKADDFVVRAYEKVRASGTQRKVFETKLSNAQGWLFCTPPLMLLNGWDFTIQKTAGADESFDTSIRQAGAISTHTAQTALTVSNTELSLISGTSSLQTNTVAGAYQLFIDPITNMVKSDEFVVTVYEKARSGGTQRVVSKFRICNAQSELWCTPPFMLLNGWDFTMKRISSVDRAFDTSIRKAG